MELTPKQKAELEDLEQMTDEDVDFSDIPESLDWSDAIRNAHQRLRTRDLLQGGPLRPTVVK